MPGDEIQGGDVVITSFRTRPQGAALRRSHDRVGMSPAGSNGVTGETELTLDEAVRERSALSGQRPVLRLPPDRVASATDLSRRRLDAAISERVIECWENGRSVRRALQTALVELAVNGYDVWMSGGLVRDALRSTNQDEPQAGDLDLAGSIPPGTFVEGILRLAGRAELPYQFNPQNGVVALWTSPEREERLLEYAPLKAEIDRKESAICFGCDTERDAKWRDLTINTLLYDWSRGYVLDPTGMGLGDLPTPVLRPAGVSTLDWPGHAAALLFRYLKFVERYPEAEVAALSSFVQDNFDELIGDFASLDRVDQAKVVDQLCPPDELESRLKTIAPRLCSDCDWDSLTRLLPPGTS